MRWVLDTAPEPPRGAPELDDDQRRVVEHRSGPLLVLAGPGTGKTTTIVEAIAARLADGTDRPEGILALTFGRKAAQELRDRIVARLGGGAVPTVATFHSFAYSLVRATDPADEFCDPPRLMSGAEEDVRVRELLRGAIEDGTIDWPEELAGALPTLGLANEVRAVLARARELGLDGTDLERIGQLSGRPAWVAVGQLAREEQEVMALENVMDYAELLVRAVSRLREPAVRKAMQARFTAIYVDEYQDTDPLQVELLRSLIAPGSSIVAVGDPDQSIYAFRGADVGGLISFPDQFRQADGSPAEVVVLRHTRRFGPRVQAVAAAALGPALPSGLPVAQARLHRTPECSGATRDSVEIRTYDTRGAQAAHVAREIRVAHIRDGVPWSQLAVLVRSGNELPAIQRALSAAGVPVVVAADEIPLRAEPAVAALLAVVDLALRPAHASPADVLDVVTGPVGGLFPTDIRRVGRALRAYLRSDGLALPSSEQLIRRLVLDPESELWEALDRSDEATVRLARLSGLLVSIAADLASGSSAQEILWTAWTGGRSPHGWPQRLRAAALAGSRSAHHDLDAVMALFDSAERFADRRKGVAGMRMFLDSIAGQQIPAEAVSERGTRADAVRVLTAHRAKGLEWDQVWIVGAQEGVWPDLRARGSTLHAEELTHEGIGPGPRAAELLEEERRLFFVACTRARQALHITAVDEGDDGGDQPSRFLADAEAALTRLGLPGVQHQPGRPGDPVSLDGLVAAWRRTAADPDADPVLREAAIERLAYVASVRDDDGEPLVETADPRTWWGIADVSPGAGPVRDAAEPVALSGSSLDSMLECPLSWFLDREARAEVPGPASARFGNVVHAVADFVAKGAVPAELDAVDAEVARVWPALRFDAAWHSEAERAEAREALSRFLVYHLRADRELVDTEQFLQAVVEVPLPDGTTDTVHVRGYLDRIERDSHGRIVPVDLKNIRNPQPDSSMADNGQLGVYQRMVHANGEIPGGAILVQLRVPAGKDAADPKVQSQEPLDLQPPTWIDSRLGAAAAIVRGEDFAASASPACRYCNFRSACPARPEGGQVTP